MYYSFRIDAPGLERAAFLFERTTLDASGDLETGFLDHVGPITRHHRTSFSHRAAALAETLDVDVLVLSRNPKLVLDEALPGRVAEAITMLAPLHGRWSLAAAGGLTTAGDRVCALYSSVSPFIPIHSSPKPLTDPLPDLYLVDAGWLRHLLARTRALPDSGFESVIVTQGYLDGRVALYAPALVAGIDGDLCPRDLVKVRLDLQDWFADSLAGAAVPTLMGPVTIERPAATRDDPRPPVPVQELAERTERVIAQHCAPLSLSIVTRTRFTRPHLLDRLLASITRARPEDAEIEVVLSSDAPLATCEAALAELKAKFVNLALRLQHNPSQGHSRVTNLLAGLRTASNTHVAVMDDDDYVDLFAFDEMQRTLFLGARPVMITGSAVHAEDWTETPSGRHVLSRSTARTTYPASGWRQMFGGVNSLPVCAVVMPREPLLARLDAFAFRHDLSEDYTLFLLLLTDPALPEIVELPGVFGHISLRQQEGQSMALQDRRAWVRDIALYLADLTRDPKVAGPGQWALLTQIDHRSDAGSAGAAFAAKTTAELRTALAERDRQLRLMQRELDRLRAEVAAAPAPSASGATKPARIAGRERAA